MNRQDEKALLSRREWLGKLALPATGAVIAAGLFEGIPAEAKRAKPAASTADIRARVYNIRDYGAKGDKTTLDTAALQAAIDACTRDGGGTVLVPVGTFVIGTVELKSNVTLHIAAGGTLLGSADGKQYHAVDAIPLRGDTTLGDGNWAMFFAVKASNITVEGPGTIDGQGAQFHSPQRGVLAPSGLRGNQRPYFVLVYQCEDVTVRNINMIDCAFHCIRPIESQRLHMEGIYIHSRVNSNNDGFHFISCEYVTVSNCIIKCGDDACAMFGSCRNITVTNCFFSTRWSVFRFGGGHAGNIAVSNCVLSVVDGCPFKFQGDAGSRFENISFSDIVLDQVTGPISISVGARRSRFTSQEFPPVVVRNISFSHIHGTITTNPAATLPESTLHIGLRPGEAHSAIVLNSVNDSVIENISFDDVHLVFGGGGTAEEGARRDVPKVFGEYFQLGPIPAYGLYARNARGITLQNVRFEVSSPELRPAVVLDHVEDVVFNGFGVQGNTQAESVMRFTGCKQMLITAARVLTPSAPFLQLEGENNEGIIVDGGDLSRAASAVVFKNGATEKSVELRNVS
ncbi:MAG: right-handed parallel beta-helix repeat-containing protein [Acidobacteriota bacterium]|nr:right-handed parallel beta-helix repeat-containing protein [Acidobacteriota bacterium]